MPRRSGAFESNNSFLVEIRGAGSSDLFVDESDYSRFVVLITHLQSPIRIYNIAWYTNAFIRKGAFVMNKDKVALIEKERSVELLAFGLHRKHARLLIKNREKFAISVYMHRVLTAYSKYFNSRYGKSGHVLAGPFKACVVKNSDLLSASAYIHKEPSVYGDGKIDYKEYRWSSYQDYAGFNRWGNMIHKEPVMKQCKDQSEYVELVKKSNFDIEDII